MYYIVLVIIWSCWRLSFNFPSLSSNLGCDIIHLMSAREGNSFVFPRLDVSRDEVEGNIEFRGKQTLSVLTLSVLFAKGTDIKCFVI